MKAQLEGAAKTAKGKYRMDTLLHLGDSPDEMKNIYRSMANNDIERVTKSLSPKKG